MTGILKLVWDEQRRLILVAGGLLSLALFLGGYHYGVQSGAVTEDREELLQLQERLRSRTADLQQVETPYRRFEQARDEVARFRESLQPTVRFPDFLARLDAVAGRSNLHLTSINYQPKEFEHSGILEYNLSFSLAGTYRDIRSFIAAIEEEKGLVTLLNVGLSSQQEGGEVQFRVGMAAYFRIGDHD